MPAKLRGKLHATERRSDRRKHVVTLEDINDWRRAKQGLGTCSPYADFRQGAERPGQLVIPPLATLTSHLATSNKREG